MPDTKPMSPERLAEIRNVLGGPAAAWWHKPAQELFAELDRLQSAVDRLANAERDLGETKLVLEQQDRDLERMRDAVRSREAEQLATLAEFDEARARIAALEAGLREACAGWEHQYVRDPQHGSPRPKIDRLRALADGT